MSSPQFDAWSCHHWCRSGWTYQTWMPARKSISPKMQMSRGIKLASAQLLTIPNKKGSLKGSLYIRIIQKKKYIYIISYLRCSAASDSPKPSRPRHEHAWNILKPWHVPPTSTNIHQLPTNCCRCRTDVEQSILAHFHYFSWVSKWPAFLFNPPNQEVSGSGQKLPPRRYMSERPLAGWAYWPLNGALAAVVAIGVSPYFGRWTYGDFIQNIQKKGGSTVQPDQAQCLETGEMDMTWLYPMDQSWNLNRIMRIWTDMPL